MTLHFFYPTPFVSGTAINKKRDITAIEKKGMRKIY